MTEASGLSSAGVSVEPELLAEAVSHELVAMLQAGNYDAVKLLLEPVQPVDIAEAIGNLPANLQAIAFRLLSKDEAISVYEYLDTATQQSLLSLLRSGEMRKVPIDCRATLGEVSNSEHSLRKLGKAGAARWRGVRPTVRGVAMNPVDHPHGGGEGKTSGGRHPVTPWGVPTKGYKTRKNKRTDGMIVRRRGKK